MIILAIETSCDETGIAVVKKNKRIKILSNVVASQVKIHEKFGGVYPALAKREHQRNLVPALTEALEEAKLLKKSKCQMTTKSCHPEQSEESRRLRTKNETLRLPPQGEHFVFKSKCQKLKKTLAREEDLFKQTKKFLEEYQKPKVEAIAVTIGPGLEPCLWVGVNFAKALGFFWDLPIITINHLEAHIAANFIGENSKFLPRTETQFLVRGQIPRPPRYAKRCGQANSKNIFPAVCLIVSGGHTQLVLMKGFGKYEILGQTRDDAAGECFDKTARILNLGYPGGPAIAAEAAKVTTESCHPERSEGSRSARTDNGTLRLMPQGDRFAINLPRPMIKQKNYDFSFSGLKTAVLYKVRSTKSELRKNKKFVQAMAREIQQAIADVLIKKTVKAAKDYKTKTIMLGGGVSANQELRKQLGKEIKEQLPNTKYLIPDTKYCIDNAAMIGLTAFWRLNEKKNWEEIQADANLRL